MNLSEDISDISTGVVDVMETPHTYLTDQIFLSQLGMAVSQSDDIATGGYLLGKYKLSRRVVVQVDAYRIGDCSCTGPYSNLGRCRGDIQSYGRFDYNMGKDLCEWIHNTRADSFRIAFGVLAGDENRPKTLNNIVSIDMIMNPRHMHQTFLSHIRKLCPESPTFSPYLLRMEVTKRMMEQHLYNEVRQQDIFWGDSYIEKHDKVFIEDMSEHIKNFARFLLECEELMMKNYYTYGA